MKKLIFCFFILQFSFQLKAQEFGTKSTEFWLTFMENLTLSFNGPPQFSIFVSSGSAGNATITAPATGLTLDFSYDENGLTEYILPDAIYYAAGSEEVKNLGLKISTSSPANVFAIHYRRYFSEGTVVLPTEVLGDEYIISAALDISGINPSSFVILATEDNTEIEIIPSTLTYGLRPAGTSFTETLDAGQIFQVQAVGDLSGTIVKSLTGKKIAVFGGARHGYINCNDSADNHLYDQLYPVSAAATEYALIPFKDQGNSIFKILATENDTEIFINESLITTLQKGEVILQTFNSPRMLTTSKGVHVSQFNPSQSCTSSGVGDPNMLQLCPSDHRISNMQFENLIGFGGNNDMFSRRYISLFTESENINNVSLNGGNISQDFVEFPDYPGFSYAEILLPPGTSSLQAPDGVLAYAYGFGEFDSYTYHLGFDAKTTTSVENLKEFLDYEIGPNPTRDVVHITLKQAIDRLSVFDVQGHLLLEYLAPETSITIDLSDLPAAIYLIKFETEKGEVSEKVLKW